MANKIIITTINPETPAIKKWKDIPGWDLILVGDAKTPEYNDPKIDFMPLSSQTSEFERKLPKNSYCRKNAGYLRAIKNPSVKIIYESDDDTIPYNNLPSNISFASNIELTNPIGVVNTYGYLSGKKVWNRGYPLDKILSQGKCTESIVEPCVIGAWQTLIDGDADVDAIYRLTSNELVKFELDHEFHLAEGVFSPFNTQSIFWNTESNVLDCMYFPCTISWRFGDILRSFIAQRIFWAKKMRLGITYPIVYQERLRSNYMTDFIDEIPLYKNTSKVFDILRSIKDEDCNLLNIYKKLASECIVESKEIDIVTCWLEVIRK